MARQIAAPGHGRHRGHRVPVQVHPDHVVGSPAQRTAALMNDPVNENVKIRIRKPRSEVSGPRSPSRPKLGSSTRYQA